MHSILSRKDFEEPPEVRAIKKFIRDNYQTEVSVLVRERDIVIGVANASLANTLRLRSPELKRRCQLDKRLTFRIGGL